MIGTQANSFADTEDDVLDNMKITMLGPSGVGKTCFMIGMYGIMREGVEGFTFSTRDLDLDLELSEAWDRMCDGSGDARWPAPNDNVPRRYDFCFNYALRPMLAFDWLDYRGGVLRARSGEDDLDELREHLRDSSAVILCISGEWIASGINGQTRRKAFVADMNRLLTEIAGESSTPPPAAIVVTKYDHCHDVSKQEMMERVRQIFHPLFAAGSGWLTLVCPVSLGPDLYRDTTHGYVDPRNIHLPVTFAVYTKLHEELRRDRSRLKRERRQLEESTDKVERLTDGPLKKWWYRQTIKSQQNNINDQRKRLHQIDREIEQLEANINRLATELIREADVFCDGEEVDYDI